MIKFSCENCSQKLSIQDQHSGKQVKCPKCSSVVVVPDNSDKIKFHCESCGQNISVPHVHAGKKGKCPNCKNIIVVPTREATPAKSTSMVSFTCSMCDETIQVPEISIGKTIECPECGSYIETSSDAAPGESDASANEGFYDEETEGYEESVSADRRIIVGIAAVAAVVVVGLIILIAVVLPSGSGSVEEPDVSPSQQAASADPAHRPVASDTQPTGTFNLEPAEADTSPEDSISSGQELFQEAKIAFASDRNGNYEIYTMNTDGSGLQRLTNNVDDDLFPSWSPDATKIAVESRKGKNPDICVINVDGSDKTNLTNNSSRYHVPSWSPDGRKIAFYTLEGDDYEICVMNSDGTELRRLTDNSTHDMGPSWSPDGMKIAFFSERNQNFDIYVMSADGSEQTRLTENPARDTSPSWSPDGKRIVFTSNRDGNHEVYVMNSDGSDQSRLTSEPANDGNAGWSADGNKIAFVSDRDGNKEIYVMNADGSGQERLTDNPAADRWPCWLPLSSSRSGPTTVAGADDADDIDLKLRLKTGQKYNLQIISETNSSQTIKERQNDYSYINTTGLELKVEQVDIKGVAWLKVTYLTIHEITKSARGQVEYDSTKPDTAVSHPNNGPLFTAMIEQSFIAKVSPEGKIIELEGLAEMYQRMTELVVENEDEATRRRMAEASNKRIEERTKESIDRLNQRYGSREKRIEATRERLEKRGRSAKKLIIEMLRNVIMPFPGRPVGIGDSWQSRTALFSLGAGALGLDECTYTLREKKQAAWLVDFSSKIEQDDELLDPESGSRATLKGSCKGSLEIDPSSGWMLHKNVTTHYSGEIRYPPTERTPQGLTCGLSMEIVITVKPIE